MIHKCANPHCSEPFKYFRTGKLFDLALDPRQAGSKPRRVLAWLCDGCSRKFTVKVEQTKLVVAPISKHTAA